MVLGASQAVKSGEFDWEMTGKSPIGVGDGKATVIRGKFYKFTSVLLTRVSPSPVEYWTYRTFIC